MLCLSHHRPTSNTSPSLFPLPRQAPRQAPHRGDLSERMGFGDYRPSQGIRCTLGLRGPNRNLAVLGFPGLLKNSNLRSIALAD